MSKSLRTLQIPLATALFIATATGAACNETSLSGGSSCDPSTTQCEPENPNNPDNPPAFASLSIEPAQAMVQVDGKPTTKTFTVYGNLPDGSRSGPLTGRWTAPVSSIGSIDTNTGVFTAGGEVGGSLDLTVEVIDNGNRITQVITVQVNVNREIVVSGTPADAATKFAGKTPIDDAAKSARILYPRNGAAMPQNVFAPDVQWEERGATGDLYRIHISKPNFETYVYSAYSGAAYKFDWLVDASVWRGVTQGNVDQDTTLTVDRYEAATQNVYTSGPVKMHFVKGALLGSIYYWEIQNANFGRVMRIDDGTNSRVQLIATPPTTPRDNSNCMGCHAVSRDGRYLFGRLGGDVNYGAIFDLTKDLSTNPAPVEYPINGTLPLVFFASFSPDSSRLITSLTGGMSLVDAKTGKTLPLGAGSTALPTTGATYPSWSPDGKSVAFTSEANNRGDALTAGNLSILPVTGADTFGAAQRIHTASSITGMTMDAYPSWSPDSKWIAFHNGRNARSNDNDANGALMLIAPTGGTPIQLTKAVGGTGRSNVFIPNFSPFTTSGYYWLTFLSRQPYGNSKAGTLTRNNQQVWVTAVKVNPAPGEDPSEVAYWLPGQDTVQSNISAYWAPRACRQDAEACTNDSQCCGGVCQNGKCAAPPVNACRTDYQGCGSDAGCCSGLECNPRTHQCVRPAG